jgi:predicted RNase H-like nuclease (RuvC/YqgF family)
MSFTNSNDEIDTKKYPFYRKIPIKHIREKQEKMISDSFYEAVNTQKEEVVEEIKYQNVVEQTQTNEECVVDSIPSNKEIRTIDENENIIKEQLKTINEQYNTIQYYSNYIEQQVKAYNNNNMAVQQQIMAVCNNYSVMANYEQQLYYLKKQIQEKQYELEQLKDILETLHQNMSLNGHMLATFNTMYNHKRTKKGNKNSINT